MSNIGKIFCSCGSCSLSLNDTNPKYSALCACEDCGQALSWASKNGANTPKDILYSMYFHSHFTSFTGINNMTAI